MKRGAVILTLGLMALAQGTDASTGGPLLARILGWDAKSQRVYCQQLGWDESLERECIYYFDLRSARPEKAQVVPWSVGAHGARDTVFARRFSALRRRLRPLEADFARAVPTQARVISDSAVVLPHFSGRRFVVDVEREPGEGPGPPELRVTTYRSGGDVRILCQSRLPGFAERIAIVSCIGDTDEGGNEVQRAVILGPRAPKPQVLDSWWGVLPWPKR